MVKKNNNSLLSLLRSIYSHSPLNFSSISGWRFPQIPRLKGNPILGRLFDLLKPNGIFNNLVAAGELAKKDPSGMCYYWVGNKLVLLITKPETIHQLLIENQHHISRQSSYRLFEIFIGSNITVDEYEIWKIKKDIYSRWLYNTNIITEYEPKLIKIVQKYTSFLQANDTIALEEFFNRYTIEVLLNTALLPNTPDQACIDKLLQYHHYVTQEIFEFKNMFKWMLPLWLRSLLFRNSLQDAGKLRSEIRKNLNDALLKPYEQEIKNNENFIHSIYSISHHKAKDKLIDDKNVFGDTNFLLLAGQDTSLSSLQFAVKLLAAHPHVEKKLQHEINEHLRNKDFTIENLNNLQYLDVVIKETLRLFPPVPFLPRDVAIPFKLNGVSLRKGDIVIFAPYLTHRLDAIWENSNDFVPERFDKMKKIPHLAYLPFGAGSHMCLGQRFAWLETKLLLATIYLNFHVMLEDNSFELMLDRGALKPKIPGKARFVSR